MKIFTTVLDPEPVQRSRNLEFEYLLAISLLGARPGLSAR